MRNHIKSTILIIATILIYSLTLTGCSDSDRDSHDTTEMKQVPVQGGELEYEIRGDGEPVLLIHGSHIAASFLPVMDEPALADYQLIRYHRRGLAGSSKHDGPFSVEEQAADALAMLQYLGIEQAHIVGHSYGGTIALQMALDAPEVVHSLSLLEPGILPETLEPPEQLQAAIARYQEGKPTEAVAVFIEMLEGPEWRSKLASTVPGGPEQAERDAKTFFEIEFPALGQWDFGADRAEKIHHPVLYIWGSETNPFIKESRDFFHSWFPEAEDHQVPGVTHSLQMEDPQAVAARIADFLDRHPLTESSNQ